MFISLWILLAIICAAGAIGGLVNGLLNSNGLLLPCAQQVNGTSIVHPGFLGNILIGMVAAALSWGLYGPLSATPLFGSQATASGFTLSALVGAILIGIAGARWITNEVDKKLLTLTANQPASPTDGSAAQQMRADSPAEAPAMARNLSQTHA